MFEQIIGHDSAKEYLAKALIEKRLPNTLLFSGPEGIGKRALALALAAQLLRSEQVEHHPDFHSIIPEGKSGLHTIESLRKAMDIAHEAPFEAPVKIFLIDQMERMQPAAANALLKTLEEPTPDSYWILLTTSPNEILPTILSRCAKLALHPPHPNQLAAQDPESEQARKLLFTLLQSPPHYAKLAQALEALEQSLETEDPLLKHRRAHHLFTSIALYYRDQTLRHLDPTSTHLFYPDLPPQPNIPSWEEPLDTARLAFERNFKLSTCLETFFLSLKK